MKDRVESTIYGIALLGAGNIARLVALCDTSEPACRAFAQKVGHVNWTGSLDELLSHPDVDVVNICTPSGTHADLGIQAAKAGKHLIVEKPLDTTLHKADRLIATARENGVKLSGIFPYRFRQGVHLARQAIEQGRLGRLVLADVYVK